jgi:hypothetical protein
VLETVQARLDHHPEKMTVRRSTAEHPFGTIKGWMGATHFLTKRLPKVATEMALNVRGWAAGGLGYLSQGFAAFKWTPTDAYRERHARSEMASRKNIFSRASCRRCGLCAMLIRVFLHSLGPSRHFACA